MTRRSVASSIAIVIAAVAVQAEQTTRIGMPAKADASAADVLVLQQVNLATGQPYGTMPAQYVVEAHRRLSGLADLAIVGWAGSGARLAADPNSQPVVSTAEATFNTLSILGVQPALGRDFTEADVLAGRRLAILTAGAWQQHFRGDRGVIGQQMWWTAPNRAPEAVEIVGVLAPGVLTATPELDPLTEALILSDHRFVGAGPNDRCAAGILRLRPGVTVATAQRLIDEAVQAATSRMSDVNRGFGARLSTLRAR